MTCHIPGMCSRSHDCHDKLCPGRGMADLPPVDSEEAEEWFEVVIWTLISFSLAAFFAVAWLGAPIVFPFN